uniref:Uncharacterized protein n=1 Tax=Meloidogyne enterolobii TaxID=390850 RepID=A0A6V7U3M4_MELEN|nr:unnamed protein product [Meloidogyne enterolobii]
MSIYEHLLSNTKRCQVENEENKSKYVVLNIFTFFFLAIFYFWTIVQWR